MTNLKALKATERVGLFTTLFENPEVTAMAAICEILQELPDDAARLRVMHWSFGRFNPEFKRPLPAGNEPVAAAPAPVTAPPPAVVAQTADQAMATDFAAVAAELGAPSAKPDNTDYGTQISELRDLFPTVTRDVHAAYAEIF